MTDQELIENQHVDQVHLDEVTGALTPIREFFAAEYARVKGVVSEDVDDVKAEAEKVKAETLQLVDEAKAEALQLIDDAKAEAEKVHAQLEDENARLKAELEALKAKPAAAKTTKAADAKPAATAVRETGDVK